MHLYLRPHQLRLLHQTHQWSQVRLRIHQICLFNQINQKLAFVKNFFSLLSIFNLTFGCNLNQFLKTFWKQSFWKKPVPIIDRAEMNLKKCLCLFYLFTFDVTLSYNNSTSSNAKITLSTIDHFQWSIMPRTCLIIN